MKFRGHNKPLASRRIDGPQLTTIDSVTFFSYCSIGMVAALSSRFKSHNSNLDEAK
jgi:hypothetical protein